MWLFPFYSAILKTSLNRQEVSEAIEQNTFLSDAGYKRADDKQKFFFGIVSPQEFRLETINESEHLSGYFKGTIKGVGNDIYVFLSLRAFKHIRIYALLIIFILAAIINLSLDLYKYGIPALEQKSTLVFCGILLALFAFTLYTGFIFEQRIQRSIAFFRGMLQADVVNKSDVPVIFRE